MASVIEPEKLEQLRTDAVVEAENISQKPRFGLFHQPPYVTNGNPFKDVPFNHRVGWKWAPEGPLKNVSTNKMKKGKNDDVLFEVPGYNGIGDTYVDPDKLARYSYVNGTNTNPKTFKAWKTNDFKKTVIEPPYPFETDVPEGEQGKAARQKRGQELHDKVVQDKSTAAADKSKPFCHGTRIHKENFSNFDYQGDDYENKKKDRRRYHSENRAKIRSGAFKCKTNIHQPFQESMYLYDHGNYETNKCKLPDCNDKFRGTRFSKTHSNKQPWRPNNPAKQGHNKTINKQHYYHQTLYYKHKEEDKTRDEKIWM